MFSRRLVLGFPDQAAGSLTYFNGTDWVSLGVGATGYVLTVTAGVPAWAPAGGGVITAADITDSTSVGRSVLTATDAAAARAAIGPITAADITDSTSVGRAVLTATDAAAARTVLALSGVSAKALADLSNSSAPTNSYHLLEASGVFADDGTTPQTLTAVGDFRRARLGPRALVPGLWPPVDPMGSYLSFPCTYGSDGSLSMGSTVVGNGESGPSGVIMMTGWDEYGAYIVQWADATHIQVVMAHASIPARFGPLVEVDVSRPHRILFTYAYNSATLWLDGVLVTQMDVFTNLGANNIRALCASSGYAVSDFVVWVGVKLTSEEALADYERFAQAFAAAAGGGTITSTDITDSTSVGRSVLTATDAAAARAAIGAAASGGSITSTDITDSTSVGRSVLTATDAAAARAAIGVAGGGTHTSGTLAARPASPAAGDTYAVTSGAQSGARFICYVAGSWEGSMSFSAGHSWERTSAASAGGGARFLDVDTGVITVSSGDDTIGWYVELGGPNLRDTCVLESTNGHVRTTANLTAFARDATTLAVLFRWDGDTGHPYYFFGSLGSRPRGLIPAINSSGTKWKLVIYQGSDVTLTTMAMIPKASFATGWHALTIAPVLHDFGAGAVDALAWSLDGSAVAYVATAIPYTTPGAADYLVAADDDAVDMPLNGAVAELAAWTSTLTGAQMAALSSVPATPTCKLPITSAMGVPEVWIQASRYDPRQPAVCPVRVGHRTVVAGASSVTRREY